MSDSVIIESSTSLATVRFYSKTKPYIFEIVFFALLFVVGSIKIFNRGHYLDFDVYHRAAKCFLDGDVHRIYSMVETGSSPFRYSPFTLPFFLPFAFLPHNVASILFFLIQFAFIGLAYYLMYKVCKTSHAVTALRVSMLVIFRYLLDSLWIGQITGLLLLFSVLYFIALKQREIFFSTLLVGVMSIFKVTHIILVLPVLWIALDKGKWKELAFGTLPFVFLVSALHVSSSGYLLKDWMGTLFMDDVYFNGGHYANQSLRGVLARFFDPKSAENIWKSIVMIAATIGLLRWKKEINRPIEMTVGLSFLFLVILSPESFKYTFSFLLFPMYAFFLSAKSLTPVKNQMATLFILHLLLNYELLGRDLFLAMYQWNIPFFGLMYLATLLFRRPFLLGAITKAGR